MSTRKTVPLVHDAVYWINQRTGNYRCLLCGFQRHDGRPGAHLRAEHSEPAASNPPVAREQAARGGWKGTQHAAPVAQEGSRHMSILRRIPRDFPVRPLRRSTKRKGRTTCGTCGLAWDDDKITGMTPAPAGRCPFEYFHDDGATTAQEGSK